MTTLAGDDTMSKPETKPHILSAKVDRWGELAFVLSCPYTLADASVRSCLMGLEPTEPCEWNWFDAGEHHKDCPAFNDREAACVDAGAGFECWPAEPDECDGFSSTEIGHVHPTEGCWAVEQIGEIGWGEAVRWAKDEAPRDLVLPIEVSVSCDDDGVSMALWHAVTNPPANVAADDPAQRDLLPVTNDGAAS